MPIPPFWTIIGGVALATVLVWGPWYFLLYWATH